MCIPLTWQCHGPSRASGRSLLPPRPLLLLILCARSHPPHPVGSLAPSLPTARGPAAVTRYYADEKPLRRRGTGLGRRRNPAARAAGSTTEVEVEVEVEVKIDLAQPMVAERGQTHGGGPL